MIKTLYSALYRDNGYPFNQITRECIPVSTPDEIKDPEAALIVWGGADINPGLYDHEIGTRTYPGGRRDYMEWAMMKTAVKLGIPIIGVCRGAQMACALAGGFLIQHAENHAGSSHEVTTSDGRTFTTNSIHHQMMFAPSTVDHELLAWSTEQRSPKYLFRNDQEFVTPEDWKEPEFYYFPKIKAFAVQWHPEAMQLNCKATKYVLEQINERTAVTA